MEVTNKESASNGDKRSFSSSPKAVNERKLMAKIDWHVLPCLCVMFLLAFLDRINIGNAAILGLKEDLHIQTGTEYNAALTIFFVPYIIFEIPSNILLKKLKPHVWLPLCMFGFGLVTVCQGLVSNWGGLMTTRWFLGMFESGLSPGCFYLIGMWYKRSEAQKRFSLFFNSSTIAGAFGGLLASGIGKMDGLRGYSGWRWVFIIEGVITCLVAMVCFFIVPGFPEDAKWLGEEEREFILSKLADDVDKVFIGGFMYLGQGVTAYGTSLLLLFSEMLTRTGYAYFAPTIIKTYGHDAIKSQLYSIPPWAAAFGLSMLIAFLSDKLRHRFIFAIIPILIAMAGFGILLIVHDHHTVQYGALFLVTSGCYSAMPVLVCWFSMNLGGHRRRSVGTAWQIGFGNIGGIISTYSFLTKDAPRYHKGYIISLSFLCFSAAMAIIYVLAILYDNKKRDRAIANGTIDPRSLPEEELEYMGDLASTFRYSY
ncbi:uncharacterized transporter C1002.16c [Aspergillus lentulus]|uniref:Major facilitator superfamily (MFS) profile domain-containing protein n=1 Tax=Aspergillus lentulus TaxID=293939 RepID=A0AAN5YU12_ASPLE|nr:hypothetical protein CNMCM8927_002862 [Aspergillus lentulus]GFG09752.1 uncharacterized transporter C1002.16c [Aspergillus lentulus]